MSSFLPTCTFFYNPRPTTSTQCTISSQWSDSSLKTDLPSSNTPMTHFYNVVIIVARKCKGSCQSLAWNSSMVPSCLEVPVHILKQLPGFYVNLHWLNSSVSTLLPSLMSHTEVLSVFPRTYYALSALWIHMCCAFCLEGSFPPMVFLHIWGLDQVTQENMSPFTYDLITHTHIYMLACVYTWYSICAHIYTLSNHIWGEIFFWLMCIYTYCIYCMCTLFVYICVYCIHIYHIYILHHIYIYITPYNLHSVLLFSIAK